jgi:hypothetical protein
VNDDQEYRRQLLALEEKAQAAFDKTVVTLSGGALGVSFAFVKDFLGTSPVMDRPWIVAAWITWVASLAASLTSHYLSTFAIRGAIHDFDAGKKPHLARGWDGAVVFFNGASGLLFLVGAAAIGVFVVNNLK